MDIICNNCDFLYELVNKIIETFAETLLSLEPFVNI